MLEVPGRIGELLGSLLPGLATIRSLLLLDSDR